MTHIDPDFVQSYVKEIVEQEVKNHVVSEVNSKYNETFGKVLTRLKWMGAGALLIVSALALERIFVDSFSRIAVNKIIGFDVSFKEELENQYPIFFNNSIVERPYLASVYNHFQEIEFKNCRDKIVNIPFHFEKEGQRVILFLEYNSFGSTTPSLVNITGRINNNEIPNLRDIDPDSSVEVDEIDITDTVLDSSVNPSRIRLLTVRVSPVHDNSGLETLVGLPELPDDPLTEVDEEKNAACRGTGGTIRILLRVIGDPRTHA